MNLEKIKSEKSIEELLQFGIINIDKPTGPTSFWTSQFVKKSLKLKKTSHFGTLDPQVTGVLPVGLNRACRLNEYLMHRNKVYVGILQTHKDITTTELEKEMENFLGKIKQLPPIKSRVRREVREREIKDFKILEKNKRNFLFISDVQAGTYIRKLISDLGEKIGGAHMLELRRTKAGIFSESDVLYPSVNLYDFEKAVEEYKSGNDKKLREIIIPGEIILDLFPHASIKPEFLKPALNGSPIFEDFLEDSNSKSIVKNQEKTEGEIIIILCNGKFVGCYKTVKDKDRFAVPELVFN